jgi:hypothetical protein
MYQFITALKDATIYKQQSNQNTGLDEILEVSKTYIGQRKEISHPLIKFDLSNISSSIADGNITASSVHLVLKECESQEVPTEYTVYFHTVSGSWGMGIGTRFGEISMDGVTWDTRDTDVFWTSGSDYVYTDGTGSEYSSSSLETINQGEGGTWYTSSLLTVSQSFEYLESDIDVDVTNIFNEWLSGTIENNGFLIKLSDEKESDNVDYGILQYFGKETNTIYQPKLRVGWDDQEYITGSLTELTEDDIHVTFKRLKSTYKRGSTPRISVIGREKYPLKTYTNQYGYVDIKYLPPTTYYQIKDAITDEIIIPFNDDYTKVSCDINGNYFKLDLTNWEINRDYYIEIKVIRNGVIEYFIDDNLTFTVEK